MSPAAADTTLIVLHILMGCAVLHGLWDEPSSAYSNEMWNIIVKNMKHCI